MARNKDAQLQEGSLSEDLHFRCFTSRSTRRERALGIPLGGAGSAMPASHVYRRPVVGLLRAGSILNDLCAGLLVVHRGHGWHGLTSESMGI